MLMKWDKQIFQNALEDAFTRRDALQNELYALTDETNALTASYKGQELKCYLGEVEKTSEAIKERLKEILRDIKLYGRILDGHEVPHPFDIRLAQLRAKMPMELEDAPQLP